MKYYQASVKVISYYLIELEVPSNATESQIEQMVIDKARLEHGQLCDNEYEVDDLDLISEDDE